jgi:hypothetical protein
MSHDSVSMIGGEGHIVKMMGGGGQEGGGAADVTLLGGFKGEIEAVQGGGGQEGGALNEAEITAIVQSILTSKGLHNTNSQYTTILQSALFVANKIYNQTTGDENAKVKAAKAAATKTANDAANLEKAKADAAAKVKKQQEEGVAAVRARGSSPAAARSPVPATVVATKAAVATPPAGPVQLELYEPYINPNEFESIDTYVTKIKISDYKDKFNRLYTLFMQNQYTNKWASTDTAFPTTINEKNKASFKLIEEITAETIVVVPPIKGDLHSFITVLQYLLEQKLLTLNKTKFILNSKAVMIFMPPFFSTEKPKELFLQFLHLYETNLKSIFILHDSNDATNKTIGDALASSDIKALLNYANPTYIFHKGKKLLFSGVKELPGLGEKLIPIVAGENPVYKEYTVFGPEGTQLPAPKTSISCKGLTSLYYSDTLKEKKYIYDTPNTLLVIRTKTQQEPLFCFGSSVTLPIPGGFQGSEGAVGGDNTIEINLAGSLYYIRKSTTEVLEQWKQKIYTQPEADFLTYLNLSPEVLTVIFGTKWPEKIAGLFQNLSETNCRTADGRKLSTDCDITRKFIQDVFQYVYTHYEYRDGGETQPRIYIADDGGTVVWPSAQDLSEIPQSRFSQTDNMIVIHKKSGKHKFYKFNGTLTDAEKGSKLKELKTKYSKFDFLYWNIDNKLEVTPSEKAAIASVLSFYSRGM